MRGIAEIFTPVSDRHVVVGEIEDNARSAATQVHCVVSPRRRCAGIDHVGDNIVKL